MEGGVAAGSQSRRQVVRKEPKPGRQGELSGHPCWKRPDPCERPPCVPQTQHRHCGPEGRKAATSPQPRACKEFEKEVSVKDCHLPALHVSPTACQGPGMGAQLLRFSQPQPQRGPSLAWASPSCSDVSPCVEAGGQSWCPAGPRPSRCMRQESWALLGGI